MIYRFNQFELDEERRELREADERISLQPLVFDALALLVRNHTRVVQKQELLDTLWPDGFVTEASLQRAVSLARSALNDRAHELIRTFSGRGYRFCADVEDTSQARAVRPKSEANHAAVSKPRIQYAKTSDGVSIAYTSVGEGTPLVCPPSPPFSPLTGWEVLAADVWEPLAETYRLIVYDSRGAGFSDRHALDFSIDAMLRDLEAVVSENRLEKFVLLAFIDAVPIAVAYAAANPGLVSHLMLVDGYLSESDFADSPQYEIQGSIQDKDWELFTEMWAQVLWRIDDPAVTSQNAEWLRASCSQEAWRAFWAAVDSRDVSAIVSKVSAPTLVVQNRNLRWWGPDVAQRIAVGIPGARLTLIDDLSYRPVPELVRGFVGVTSPARLAMPAPPLRHRVILFADIVDSTALTERLGDDAFRAKARELDGALRTVIRENGGTPIDGKLLGDGVLAVFTSARHAIEAALACGRSGADAGLPLHLGLHAGDVIREEGNVYGGSVIIASRICALSAPGELLVSDTVRSLARTSAGVSFEDRGEHSLKGIEESVRVYEVRWRDG